MGAKGILHKYRVYPQFLHKICKSPISMYFFAFSCKNHTFLECLSIIHCNLLISMLICNYFCDKWQTKTFYLDLSAICIIRAIIIWYFTYKRYEGMTILHSADPKCFACIDFAYVFAILLVNWYMSLKITHILHISALQRLITQRQFLLDESNLHQWKAVKSSNATLWIKLFYHFWEKSYEHPKTSCKFLLICSEQICSVIIKLNCFVYMLSFQLRNLSSHDWKLLSLAFYCHIFNSFIIFGRKVIHIQRQLIKS